MNRVAILGAGPVGLATALMLSKHQMNQIELLDTDPLLIGSMRAPRFNIPEYEYHELEQLWTKVFRSNDVNRAKTAKYVVVCIPAPMNKEGTEIDTTEVRRVVRDLLVHSDATIVIRSTLPIGFTHENYMDHTDRIVYWPEFIRDRHFMSDAMDAEYVIGGTSATVHRFVEDCLLLRSTLRYYVSQRRLMITGWKEAEAIKLLRNNYLAGRVAFLNMVSETCDKFRISMLDVFTGVTADKRIGHNYANSSFGFGGKCLPKDVVQLEKQVKDFSGLPTAYRTANESRQKAIAQRILRDVPHGKTIGLISLEFDPGEMDAVWEVAKMVRSRGYHRVIVLSSCEAYGKDKIENVNTIAALTNECDVIYTANRWVDIQGVNHV